MGWYTLMSKSYKLVDVEISDMGEMISTGTIYDRSRLNPSCESGLLEDIYKWWESRCIPSSRKHLKDIERNLGITNIKYLAKVAYGASLSDQYWIKPKDSDLTWDLINFFHNDFSDEMEWCLRNGK